MSQEENARIVRRYYEEMWNLWDFALAEALLAPGIQFRGSLGREVQGIPEFLSYMHYVQSAFPDFSNKIEDLICEGEKVVARLTYRGTHRGELFGIPATGRQINYSGVAIFQNSGGKISDGWVLGDTTELMRQLNALPMPAQAAKTDPSFEILAANYQQREWAATLMAGSEPWVRLGRSPEACRCACHRPDSLLFVALASGEPCGFIILQRRGLADSPYIKSLAVAEQYRGRGIGTRLTRFAEQYFRGHSRHLFLCVSSFNTRARALYESLGFSTVTHLADYVIPGASEILMHKPLET